MDYLQASQGDPRLQEPLPRYGTLSAEQYRELGFKVGLEIHQQLLTDRKLFCRCPAGLYTEDHDAEILRHMRPTLSEMGEYDGTALMEFKTQKNIIYLLKNESVCTYEMDDAPPFELNGQALDRAAVIAMMLGCKIVGELHITRKQYLDGSIPTGFQRTAIVGVDGTVPFGDHTVRIRQLAVEEDSCREVSDRRHTRTYRTDRLGMPLIEIVTDPDMQTPQEAAAVGEILRRLTRASGLVRTGAGAARQDVNVSITGGTRIEIKGVPSLRAIPKLVHSEALRQRSLLAIKDILARRGVTAERIRERSFDVTGIVRHTDCRFVRKAVDNGAVAWAVPLPGFEGLLGAPTQPRTTFLKEFSDRVRVIACLDELPNLACSTHETTTLSSIEWDRVGKACGVAPETPVLVVWGPQRDVVTACQEIVIRAREATLGVPSETRQAMLDGTNGFERILPGPDRMYPDTDEPPIPIADGRLEKLQRKVPETPWQRLERLRGLGVGANLSERLARHAAYGLFLKLSKRLGGLGNSADAGESAAHAAPAGTFSHHALASLLLDRHCARPARPGADDAWWERAVDCIVSGQIVPEAAWWGGESPAAALAESEARRICAARLAELAEPAESAGPEERGGLRSGGPADGRARVDWAMDHVMQDLRGRTPGREVRRWVEEALA
jgi:glutamyl-tRNA(Gln) amidotransferase subunit E